MRPRSERPKEANDLERVEAGLVEELEEVLTAYERPLAEDLARVLRAMPLEHIQAETGYGRRQAYYLRSGQRAPSPGRLPAVLACAARFARERIAVFPPEGAGDDAEAVRQFAAIMRAEDVEGEGHVG